MINEPLMVINIDEIFSSKKINITHVDAAGGHSKGKKKKRKGFSLARQDY